MSAAYDARDATAASATATAFNRSLGRGQRVLLLFNEAIDLLLEDA